jgi:protein DGCR14
MSTSKPTNTPPPRSLNRQIVLDEDEYTEGLAHIIARDFFPSLVHLDATNNYLDALQSQDPDAITATVRRLEELNTPVTRRGGPAQTPVATPYGGAGFETPLRTPRGETPAKRRRYNTDLGLDEFQARYTSEDNSSFLQILDDENKKRKEKYGWAWQAQKRVEELRDKMIEGRQRMLIEASDAVGVREKLKIEAPAPVGLIAQGETSSVGDKPVESNEQGDTGGELIIRQASEDEEDVDVMAPKKDKRPAGVDGWKFKVCRVIYSSQSINLT